MKDLVQDVQNTLDQYGYEIYNDYSIEDKQHIFLVKDMILYVDNKNRNISIAFEATAKPDVAARNTIILKENINDCSIEIMESFIRKSDKSIACGDEAFTLVKKSIELKAIQKFIEEQQEKVVLVEANCFNC